MVWGSRDPHPFSTFFLLAPSHPLVKNSPRHFPLSYTPSLTTLLDERFQNGFVISRSWNLRKRIGNVMNNIISRLFCHLLGLFTFPNRFRNSRREMPVNSGLRGRSSAYDAFEFSVFFDFLSYSLEPFTQIKYAFLFF